MKKILIVTNHYLPGYKAGGPVKSVSSLCDNLNGIFDFTVMTSNYDFGENTVYSNIEFDKPMGFSGYKIIYLSKINFNNIRLFINDFSPDVIYLNSFFSNFTQIVLVLKKLNLIKSKIILATRGELSDGALSIKSKKKYIYLKVTKFLKLYSNDIVFHSTDEIETKDIQKLFTNKVHCIANLTATTNKSFQIAKKVEDEIKIIFLSRISRKKNLLYALEVLQNYKYEGNIIFDIYGTLEDKPYWDECLYKISLINDNITVKYKSSVEPKNISKIMSQYHLFFLPTRNENFGHAIVEAMQNGLIPLISDQTPWHDAEYQKIGYSINLENKKDFALAISTVLKYSQSEYLEASKNVQKYIENRLNNDKLIEDYINMFNSEIL